MHLRGALAALAALAVAAACSSERIVLDVPVAVAPNPFAGVPDGGERRWNYSISIANTSGTGLFLESFHTGISGTDTGYEQPLLPVRDAEFTGRYIRPGQVFAFPVTERTLGLPFTRGVERRIYHLRGDDGRFYSGEVFIELR